MRNSLFIEGDIFIMAETTQKSTAKTQFDEPTPIRTIGREETPWGKNEEDKKGKFFKSLEEQLGVIRMDLGEPVTVSDREEKVDYLLIKPPSEDQLKDMNAVEGMPRQAQDDYFKGCIINVPKNTKLSGYDWVRLTKLVSNFSP